jgi:hypothetical protein
VDAGQAEADIDAGALERLDDQLGSGRHGRNPVTPSPSGRESPPVGDNLDTSVSGYCYPGGQWTL